MRRTIKLFLLALLAASATLGNTATAQQNDAFALFEQFLTQPVATLAFEQQAFNSKDALLYQTTGVLSYQRPNLFRLQYASPEQPLIVADGEIVWIYEAEIEQATAQPFASAEKNGLIETLTSGSADALKKDYVLSAGIDDTLRWINANALDQNSPLKRISLAFATADGTLQKVLLVDHFGGKIIMHINDIQYNIHDAEDVFSFTPPLGSEVIDIQ
ncbi:MAG: outer membrane lipoprotein chaperone LolA [Proteobacteria bacterium]|nr:outer membrane lipoprotein chaperone LolA [Pseudomonadota bacterium]